MEQHVKLENFTEFEKSLENFEPSRKQPRKARREIRPVSVAPPHPSECADVNLVEYAFSNE